MADELVFRLNMSPSEVMQMDLSDVLYWHERARLFFEEEHARSKMNAHIQGR